MNSPLLSPICFFGETYTAIEQLKYSETHLFDISGWTCSTTSYPCFIRIFSSKPGYYSQSAIVCTLFRLGDGSVKRIKFNKNIDFIKFYLMFSNSVNIDDSAWEINTVGYLEANGKLNPGYFVYPKIMNF